MRSFMGLLCCLHIYINNIKKSYDKELTPKRKNNTSNQHNKCSKESVCQLSL
ncbi:hypothetical protein Hanom_Chr07g00626791 [Helianthus anomalus]